MRIPRDVRLSLNYFDDDPATGPTFSEGEGLAALVIRGADGFGFTAVRLPEAKGQPQRYVSFGPDNCQVDRSCSLASGEYDVFIVTQGPVAIDVRLDGLKGRSHVTASAPVTGEISEATETYSVGSNTPQAGFDFYGTGFSPLVSGTRNLVFSAFWFHGPTEPVAPSPADHPVLNSGVAGGCVYWGGKPPADAFAPGCPTGENHGTFTTARALDDFGFEEWSELENVGAGTYSLGNYAVHTGVLDPGFIGFWIALD